MQTNSMYHYLHVQSISPSDDRLMHIPPTHVRRLSIYIFDYFISGELVNILEER